MNKIELLPIKKEQVMIPQDSTTGFRYETVRLQNVWTDVEDKINELVTAWNAFIEERNAPKNATLREQFRTPTADEVCEAINKIIEPYKAIYEEETNLFIYEDDGVVLADESQTDAFLKIALFYTYGEGKR